MLIMVFLQKEALPATITDLPYFSKAHGPCLLVWAAVEGGRGRPPSLLAEKMIKALLLMPIFRRPSGFIEFQM
jgi:hypothetical protein